MSNFGPLGWVTDKDGGYRYERTHPKNGAPWPPLPDLLLKLWQEVSHYDAPPQACLINWYREDSKMGLHIDQDEHDICAPVISVSLGDPADFKLGGPKRGGKTHGLKLMSGDVVVLGGDARMCYHGVSKIHYGQSALVPRGGRINLTMRRVTAP
jgi:alkylated DNA repair protein (DNA oxidative demethylase)